VQWSKLGDRAGGLVILTNGSSGTKGLFTFEADTFSETFVCGQENSVTADHTQQSISYEWSIHAW
jgi:hypothetical protein